jgi:hypothetical protein
MRKREQKRERKGEKRREGEREREREGERERLKLTCEFSHFKIQDQYIKTNSKPGIGSSHL